MKSFLNILSLALVLVAPSYSKAQMPSIPVDIGDADHGVERGKISFGQYEASANEKLKRKIKSALKNRCETNLVEAFELKSLDIISYDPMDLVINTEVAVYILVKFKEPVNGVAFQLLRLILLENSTSGEYTEAPVEYASDTYFGVCK